jgi:hypothetical protein
MKNRIKHIIRKRRHDRFIRNIICDIHNELLTTALDASINPGSYDAGILSNKTKLIKKYSRRLALLNY